jgi:hypothetical protein
LSLSLRFPKQNLVCNSLLPIRANLILLDLITWLIFDEDTYYKDGPGSSVGIAKDYGLDGPGIESWWGRDFPRLSRPALGPTQPPIQWVQGFFPRVKCGPGVLLTTHPLLVLRSWKSSTIAPPILWATPGL